MAAPELWPVAAPDTRHAGRVGANAAPLTRRPRRSDELEAVTRAEGISVSDAVREAIAEHIARKRKDKAFRERFRVVVERDREILERLSAEA